MKKVVKYISFVIPTTQQYLAAVKIKDYYLQVATACVRDGQVHTASLSRQF